MITPFLIGLAFAAAERVVQTIISHSFRFKPAEILQVFVLEFPPFLAFAFIAGVGAEWISDKTHNRALEIVVAGGVWVFCLLLRNVLCSDLWWLRSSLLSERLKLWRWSTIGIGVFSLLLALSLFPTWQWATGLSMYSVVVACCICFFVYLACLLYSCINRHAWVSAECVAYLSDLLHLYCTKSPDGADRIFRNPLPHQAQDSQFYIAKFYVAYREWTASQQCCCLETQLVKSISEKFCLSEKTIREIVRSVTKSVATDCELEYYALMMIVANDAGYKRAKDVIEKSEAKSFLPVFESMRSVVTNDGRLMDC